MLRMPTSAAFAFAARRIIAAVAIGSVLHVAGAAPTLTPLKPSGIYALGETAGWTLANPTGEVDAGEFTYQIRKNNDAVLASGRLSLTEGARTMAVTLDEPAMLYAEVTRAGDASARLVAGAAVAPSQLRPSVARPADFDEFWARKIELLRSVPAAPVLKPVEGDRPGVELATIKLNNIQGATIHGQIARPAREGKFPAMLVLQWAGGPYPLQKSWVTAHAANGWLALNIEPHDVPGDMPPEFYAALPRLIKNYQTLGNTDRDQNYFLRMYLGAYRAVDYLASRPDWNGQVMLATGTSMGGQQSFAVAGLHPKVTHMITHVPAGADSNGTRHGRNAGYPNWDHTNAKVMETALYFDIVNFAPRIRATSLVSMGFVDTVCPPVGIWIAFNQIAGPKEVVPLVDAAHNHQATAEQQRAHTDRAAEWMRALVRDGRIDVR
jgi:cephalosporin-C deacetylase